MKKLGYSYLFLYIFSFSELYSISSDVDHTPNVYNDISESAQENSVSFGGIRGLLGLGFDSQNFWASAGNNENFTDCNLGLPMACVGIEYSKTLKKNFWFAIDADIDISKKGKKEGSWATINNEYELQYCQYFSGNRTGCLETESIRPGISLKCGYLFYSYAIALFAKLGIYRIGETYNYNNDGNNVCKVNVVIYSPTIGIGVFKKINKSWGFTLETGASIKKGKNDFKQVDQQLFKHSAKNKRFYMRLMGTYDVSK